VRRQRLAAGLSSKIDRKIAAERKHGGLVRQFDLGLREAGMWVTGFALALAAAVWFSAANLAVQFHRQRDAFIAAVEDRPVLQPDRQITSAHVREEPRSTRLN
jgi:hypothetical protein